MPMRPLGPWKIRAQGPATRIRNIQETLRRRFANALEWYTQLVLATRQHTDTTLDAARVEVRKNVEPQSPDAPSGTQAVSVHPSPAPATSAARLHCAPGLEAPGGKKRGRSVSTSEDFDDEAPAATLNPFPDPPPLTRPSDYLVSRCPACFGGLKHDGTQSFDVAVCVDGNFTQKRRKKKGGQDPPKEHPNSVFIPETLVRKMDAYVESVRAAKKGRKKKARKDEDDCYEGPLKVPRSALDTCEASFKAADEKREKASTQFFADTGLMALLCRHDRVLWLVNMRSAGEKQYYILLLLEMLFQHLPLDILVGLLYDIACQTNRSCVIFGFLGRYLHRLVWAVSVFHAYAHAWACQVIYHPLKCVGFGFTNGEGAERFWFSISKLIGYLRVAGVRSWPVYDRCRLNNILCSIIIAYFPSICKWITTRREVSFVWPAGWSAALCIAKRSSARPLRSLRIAKSQRPDFAPCGRSRSISRHDPCRVCQSSQLELHPDFAQGARKTRERRPFRPFFWVTKR